MPSKRQICPVDNLPSTRSRTASSFWCRCDALGMQKRYFNRTHQVKRIRRQSPKPELNRHPRSTKPEHDRRAVRAGAGPAHDWHGQQSRWWTRRESNPDHRLAKPKHALRATSPWVEPRGVEPPASSVRGKCAPVITAAPWWNRPDLNRPPLPCRGSALPNELRSHFPTISITNRPDQSA